jgi:hypothetical protein
MPREIAERNEEDFIVINLNVFEWCVRSAFKGGKINIPFIPLDNLVAIHISITTPFKLSSDRA